MGFMERLRIDSVVDCFAADVGFFKIDFHKTQLARDLVGRKAFSKQVDNQLKALIARDQLLDRSTGYAAFAGRRLSFMGRITANELIAANLTTDSGRASPQHPSYFALTEALTIARLEWPRALQC